MNAKRVAQLIGVVNLAILLAALALNLSNPARPPTPYPGLWPLDAIVYSVLAVLIIARHPRHTVGWLFVITGFFMAVATLITYGLYGYLTPEDVSAAVTFQPALILIVLLVEASWVLALFTPLLLLLLYFPDGRLLSPRWRPVAAATVIVLVEMVVATAAQSSPEVVGLHLLGLTGQEPWLGFVDILLDIIGWIGGGGALAAVVVRYRRSRGVERLQMKWFLYTVLSGVIGIPLVTEIWGPDSPFITLYITTVPALVAVAVAVAILRYGLYNIDIIIRRTLQYGLVSGILALVYFGLVVTLQSLITAVGGQQSPITIVLSTLVIAALFNPVRHRVQRAVDRRFYRQKYDAEQALATFAATARDEVDLERLTGALLAVVEETMQPERVTLWLDPERD
ncbi:MAG: hypothetical protein R3300_08075 [Candidatus Promineifilaceae bacterium]|nr:hypothetical protein [Candidatus Promineifilaceae bacterium]